MRQDLLILTGVVFLTYGASLTGDIVGDDLILVRNARAVSWSFHDLIQSFQWGHNTVTDGWLPPTFKEFHLQYFRPIIMASIKLDYALWGTWAAGYHLTNILLYLAVTLIVYSWGSDFGLDRRRRFLLGLLFATYSVNQLAVVQINGRTELMAAIFILSSVICLGRFYSNRSPLFFVGAFVAALLALGAKENSVMLPFFHICAALFLYAPKEEDKGPGIRLRVWSIVPFLAMVPIYLLIRSAFLDGFPIPPRGFYFHPPADPGFTVFLISKLAHVPLALVFQIPALIFPVIMERSMPLLLLSTLVAIPTAIIILRWIKPPFRYFFIGWIALSLAPTLPMGHHPIYYFVCSPVIALLYVQLYETYSVSTRPWQVQIAKILLPTALILSIMLSIGNGILVNYQGIPSQKIARNTIKILDENLEAQEVFFIDVPPVCIYMMMPAIRYEAERYADKTYATLAPTSDMAGIVPSEITQHDEFSFDIRPAKGAYLRTGLEAVLLAKTLPTFRPGMIARHADYEIEVLEVESEYITDEGPIITALRRHFDFPPETHRGILALRFRFKSPLASEDRLFLQIQGTDVRKVTFQ